MAWMQVMSKLKSQVSSIEYVIDQKLYMEIEVVNSTYESSRLSISSYYPYLSRVCVYLSSMDDILLTANSIFHAIILFIIKIVWTSEKYAKFLWAV